MKRHLILFFFICTLSISTKGQSIDFGIGPTIAFNSATFGAQAKLAYFMTERFHPAVTYSYFIRDDVNYAVDADARFQLLNVEEYFISPLIGVNLSRFDGQTGVGLNAGIFCEIEREVISLYLEPKFVLDTDSFFVLSGGIYF